MKIKRSSEVRSCEVEAEVILYHGIQEAFFVLSGGGAIVWSALSEKIETASLLESIAKDYELSEGEMFELREYLDELIEMGVVELC